MLAPNLTKRKIGTERCCSGEKTDSLVGNGKNKANVNEGEGKENLNDRGARDVPESSGTLRLPPER